MIENDFFQLLRFSKFELKKVYLFGFKGLLYLSPNHFLQFYEGIIFYNSM